MSKGITVGYTFKKLEYAGNIIEINPLQEDIQKWNGRTVWDDYT